MNKEREKRLLGIIDKLEASQSDLQIVLDEEQEYHDAIPESMSEGERAARSQEYLDALEQGISDIGETIDTLRSC